MKEEVVNKLAEKGLQYLNSAEAFIGKEVPQFLTELLEFKAVEHLIMYFDDLILISIVLLVSIFGAVWANKYSRKKVDGEFVVEDYELRDILKVAPVVFSIFLGVLFCFSIGGTNHLVQAYKAYKAPRVYLVDYFKGEIKK